ncbi:hypothetical protein D3C71_153010 [compost metagenome]
MTDAADTTPSERLKLSRNRAGFSSAKKVADQLDVPLPTYAAHENGRRDFDRSQCLAYAALFSVDPAWLMFGSRYGQPPEGTPPPPPADRQRVQKPNEVELLNVTIGGEGTIRIVHSRDMTGEKAKNLLRQFLPTVLESN